MRVAVVNLTAGGMSGGYRKYLRNLIPRLADEIGAARLRVFVPPAAVSALDPVGEDVLQAWPEQDARRGFPWLREAVCGFRADVMFLPTARWLRVDDVPTAVMVRNTEPLVVPFGGNTVREGMRNLLRARVARQACRSADRVIAVSAYVRDLIVSRWRLPTDAVGVVYHGVEHPGPSEQGAQVPLPGPVAQHGFLFTAGSVRPARGLEDLIRALGILKDKGHKVTLAIAGKPDPGALRYSRMLSDLAARLGVGGQVHWLGQLGPAEMAWCYTHCAMFIMTSRAEACPNTALEAMSHGASCISGCNPPMPEFFGNSALYYRLRDPVDLARAIGLVLVASSKERAGRAEAARERVAGLTWDRTAAGTLRELRLLLL